MKLGNYVANSGMSNYYLEQAKNNQSKALNNITAQRALSGVDSANLAIADSLRSQSSSLEQGIANANDAIAVILNNDQKRMIGSEADALVNSMRDSIKQASFNGKDVFNGEMTFLTGNGMQSISLSTPNFNGIDVNDQKSITDFIGNVNSLRGEIGAAQNGILSGINASLAKNVALKQSESQLQNNDIAKNVSAFKQNDLQANAAVLAQAHNAASLQSQFNRLLG